MRHSLTRRLPYTPAQLFALVGDVERYPEFVPWVTALTTCNRKTDADEITTFDAEAKVKFAIIHERFSTRVTLSKPALAIDVVLISGPFKRLENRWCFAPDAEGTRLEFEIEFEFASRLLERVLALNAGYAVNRLMGCFEARAAALYR